MTTEIKTPVPPKPLRLLMPEDTGSSDNPSLEGLLKSRLKAKMKMEKEDEQDTMWTERAYSMLCCIFDAIRIAARNSSAEKKGAISFSTNTFLDVVSVGGLLTMLEGISSIYCQQKASASSPEEMDKLKSIRQVIEEFYKEVSSTTNLLTQGNYEAALAETAPAETAPAEKEHGSLARFNAEIVFIAALAPYEGEDETAMARLSEDLDKAKTKNKEFMDSGEKSADADKAAAKFRLLSNLMAAMRQVSYLKMQYILPLKEVVRQYLVETGSLDEYSSPFGKLPDVPLIIE